MSTPEFKVKRKIKEVLDEFGAYYFMAVQTGYGNATVDFLCCVPRVITQEMVGLRFGVFIVHLPSERAFFLV